MEQDNSTQKTKSFGLSTLALNNKISVYILTALIVIAGIGIYITLPKELFPEISFPQVYVSTVYPGNSPKDIENLVTRPLEKELKSVDGLKTLKSTSVQDFSAIIVEFNTDVNIEDAVQDVKDAVDKAKKELPTDLNDDPQVIELNASEFPIMNINLSGDYSIDDLKNFGEYLKDEIELVNEIDKVQLKGALEREVSIEVDLHQMEQSQISFMDIEQAIANENLTIAGGDVLLGTSRRSIRTDGEFKSVKEIEDIIVKYQNNDIVYLRDIATVTDAYEEIDSYARLDGKPVVSLDVVKKSGENLLSATDAIGEIIEKAQKEQFPSDLRISITNDQSEQTRNQISNLENSIIMGVILVVLILLFFLGVRNALFVGIAIPLSMFLSFIVLSAMGLTMNLVVLFSLILALGMLVDNGIVTVENIYRLYEQGYSKYEAAKQGVGEVALPIISSTATTLAAFFPLLFWKDLMGEFMKFLPMTLIAVLTSSLFVALVINPVIAASFVKHEDYDKVNGKRLLIISAILVLLGFGLRFADYKALGSMFIVFAALGYLNAYVLKPTAKWFQEVALVKLESAYESTLRWSLAGWKPFLLFLGMIPLLFGSIIIYFASQPKTVFFPVNEPKYINVFIEAPQGTDILKTDSLSRTIEEQIFNILKPYEQDSIVSSVVANVGRGTNDPNEGPSMNQTPHKARITISFVEFRLRKGHSTRQIMRELTNQIVAPAGILIKVQKNNDGPPVGSPINLEITGENLDSLIQITERLKRDIDALAIPGIENLKMDIETGKPELILSVDRTSARSYGLSTAQIASTVRTALFGKEVSKFKDGEDDYPIQLRLERKYRYNISNLMNQRITFRNPANGRIVQVPISSVSSYENSTSVGSVKRKDQDRVITLLSGVEEGYNANDINKELKAFMSTYKLPAGYSYAFTGEQEQQADSMAFLMSALGIAVALITLILVSQFNSIVKPIIIVISVGLSLIGVFLGLAFTQMDFVVIMTGIGIVSLAGIVVNNAIVLIDYIDLLKTRKKEELSLPVDARLTNEDATEAVIIGGKTRLRPVLLTAITTVLGLIPLATGMNLDFIGLLASFEPDFYMGGDNAIFWGPMAWTVIFGLTFATFLTLIIVPVMYVLFERARKYLIPKK